MCEVVEAFNLTGFSEKWFGEKIDFKTNLHLEEINEFYCNFSNATLEYQAQILIQAELTCFLERCVWPCFPHPELPSLAEGTDGESCFDRCYILTNDGISDRLHENVFLMELKYLKSLILVIALILNEKFRQGTEIWTILDQDIKIDSNVALRKLRILFCSAWLMFLYPQKFALQAKESVILIQFFIHMYQSLEHDIVRAVCMPTCSLASWLHLSQNKQIYLLKNRPELRKPWKVLLKRSQQLLEKKRHLFPENEQAMLSYLDLHPDSPNLTLDERFMLVERDALYLALRSIIRLIEVDWANAISPQNILCKKEALESIPKTLTDVFLGTFRDNINESRQHSLLKETTPHNLKRVTPKHRARDTDISSLMNLRNENPTDLSNDDLLLFERFLEFNIDLLAQLPTRRFFRPIFMAQQPVVRIRNSPTYLFVEAGLVRQLVAILSSYANFEIDDNTGEPLDSVEVQSLHYNRLIALQKIAFQHLQKDFPQFKQMALGPISKYDTPEALRNLFKTLPVTVLLRISDSLNLVDALSFGLTALEPLFSLCNNDSSNVEEFQNVKEYERSQSLLVEVLVDYLSRAPESLAAINELPLFPTECLLWDPNLIPTENYQGNFSLALPKLNLQFLTIRDYLMRNFHLFRLESAYEIRQHIEEIIARMEPQLVGAASLPSGSQYSTVIAPYQLGQHYTKNSSEQEKKTTKPLILDPCGTTFRGSSRWAVPIQRLSIVFIKPPILGQCVSSEVRAEIIVNLANVPENAAEEWDAIRPNDVLFLSAIQLQASSLNDSLTLSTLRELSTVAEFPERFGVLYIRGCEVVDILDEEGQSLFTFEHNSQSFTSGTGMSIRHDPYGSVRTYRVLLDCYQHYYDMCQQKHENIYSTFNLLIRRPAAENNFKSVLDTIRRLMNDNEHTVIPSWLHDLFLGYGDPRSAQYFRNPDWFLPEIDFYDTFIDSSHLRESFPDIKNLEITTLPGTTQDTIPYFLTKMRFSSDFTLDASVNQSFHPPQQQAQAEIYPLKFRTPYPHQAARLNTLRFTRAQVECIRSGVHQGLTMIVGPPGTGKTDTAVQIVNLLHRNFPEERVLIIAHSNQALNDLFEKIAALDIDERYLLRLGAGEKELRAASDETLYLSNTHETSSLFQGFSKQGRINFMLQKRLILLEKITELGSSLCVPGDVGASCETAIQFFRSHIAARIQRFWKHLEDLTPSGKGLRVILRDMREADKTSTHWLTKRSLTLAITRTRDITDHACEKNSEGQLTQTNAKAPSYETVEERDDLLCQQFYDGKTTLVECLFPFTDFFHDVPGGLFPKSEPDKHLETAKKCFCYLADLCKQIQECRVFELLRNFYDQTEYLLTRHAKITAMTCTHAALARQHLLDMRFTYSTLLIEESAQILEIETFVPMLLQRLESPGISRLKRVILIGDHHQLPPVVKNRGFQHYGHLDQSMFTRFIRLQVPYIQLDAQGRCRPILRELFDWKYTCPALGDLADVKKSNSIFSFGNPGFYFTHQWIDVPDFNGRGETTVPFQPHMYQNLGEAEFVVAVFMYMRLLGYPAERIVLLTTYNGQRQLIREIISKRCGWNPVIGWPAAVSTVDRFQGQQADYVLISLVRTQRMGYLRDIRRMIVAVSRARLGLYVFGRLHLLKQCHEWDPILKRLIRIPSDFVPYSKIGSLILLPEEHYDLDALPSLSAEDKNDSFKTSTERLSRSLRSLESVSEATQMWKILQTSTQRALAQLAETPQV